MNTIVPGGTAVWVRDETPGQTEFTFSWWVPARGHWDTAGYRLVGGFGVYTEPILTELDPHGWTVEVLTTAPFAGIYPGYLLPQTIRVTAAPDAPITPYDTTPDPGVGIQLKCLTPDEPYLAYFPFRVVAAGFGLCIDCTGTMWSAVPDGENLIRTYRITGAIADKEPRGTLHGVNSIGSPGMCVDERNRKYLLLQRDGAWVMLRSDDDCRNWTDISMSAPWPSGYVYADPVHLGTGSVGRGFGSIAVESATNKLWWRFSPDGATWTAAPRLIATLSGPSQYRLVFVPSTGRLNITDGVNTQYTSVDSGRNWGGF